MIFVIATLTIRPGTRDDVLAAAEPCLVGTRKEAGCISYDLLQNTDDENQLVFVERWESREALAEHFNAPHLVAWRLAGEEFVTDKRVEVIDPKSVDIL